MAQDLLDTLTAHNEGIYMVMFNPEIVKYSDLYETEERCLSLEGHRTTKLATAMEF